MKRAWLALALSALVVAPSVSTTARHRILFSRLGPVRTALFVSNADGSGERELLAPTGLDYSPALSDDGQWIVFTSERNGSADLYRVHPDGTALERLTDDPAYDDQAALSPDGSTVAFVSTRGTGRAHVWLLDVAARTARQLTAGSGSDFRPGWSPDGQWIAFSSDRDSHPGDLPGRWEHLQSTRLFIVRRDGTGFRALTPAGGFAGTPKWSADGTRIVCYETSPLGTWYAQRGDAAQGHTAIVSIDVASGARTEHATGNAIRLWPQFLPDGRIGYVRIETAVASAATPVGLSIGGAANDGTLEIVDAGGRVTRGPRSTVRSPNWSRDGRRVVYHRVLAGSQPRLMLQTFSRQADFDLVITEPFPSFSRQGDRLLYSATPDGNNVQDTAIDLMRADGSEPRRLFARPGFSAFSPAWSPAGDLVAFSVGRYFRAAGHPTAQVAIMRADGGEVRMIADDEANNGFPSWSPDGRRIVYKKDKHLVVFSLEDGKTRDLTTPAAQYDNFPAWSPKGDRIAFTSNRDGDFEIYTIRPDGTDLRRLTRSPGNDGHQVWSPDGEWLLFSSARMGFKDERPLAERIPQPYGELFLMRADGTDLRQLTDNQWEDATPAWKPETLPATPSR